MIFSPGVSSDGEVISSPGVSSDGGVSSSPGVSSDGGVSSSPGVSSDGGVISSPGVSSDGGVSSSPGVSSDGGVSSSFGVSSADDVLSSSEINSSESISFSREPFIFRILSSFAETAKAVVPALFIHKTNKSIQAIHLSHIFFLFTQIPPQNIFSYFSAICLFYPFLLHCRFQKTMEQRLGE